METRETRLLTIPEVAERCHITRSRAYTLVRDGLIPAVRLGRQVRIDSGMLEKWIKEGGKSLQHGWRR